MHICKNCGTEFEGKFCPECGAKFISEDVCPKCGTKHSPEAKFCSECGAALQGGKPQKPTNVSVGDRVRFWICFSGVICVLLSALIGLVFAFVSGFALKVNGEIVETEMLYDYFGGVYKDLDEMKELILSGFHWKSMGGAREFALYFPVVLGTVISAVGLLGVVALSAFTAFRVYKKYYKKEEANIVAPAAATYLTFAALATLLLVLNMMEGSLAADLSNSPKGKVVFSTPTLAGLITGGVLLGLGLLLIAGSNYKNFKGFNASVGAVASVAVCAFTVVVIGLMELPMVGASMSIPGAVSTEMSFNPLNGMQAMLSAIKDDTRMFEIIAYGTVGGIALIALAVISAVTLFRKISVIHEGKNKSNIVLCGVSVALAVLCLVFSVLLINTIITASLEASGLKGDDIELASKFYDKEFAAPIAILVMTVLALAAELVGKFVRKGDKYVAADGFAETSVAIPAQPEEIPAQEEQF